MVSKSPAAVHWSFWVIGGVALIWNVLGCISLFTQIKPELLVEMPELYWQIVETRPVWATTAFAISIVGGVLGGLLLLLRKTSAFYLFIASLVATVLTMGHAVGLYGAATRFGSFELILGFFVPLVVAAFLVWYFNRAVAKGWISDRV